MYVFCACTSMWGSLLAQWRAEARVLKARETNLGRLWYGTVPVATQRQRQSTAQDKRVAKGSARKAPASQTRYH